MDATQAESGFTSRGLIVALFAAGTLAGVGATSTFALLTTLLDGGKALVILAGPVLAGLYLVPLLRPGPLPLRWHLLLGAALGIGALSTLALLLGLLGMLQRPLWLVLHATLVAAGVFRLRTLLIETDGNASEAPATDSPGSGAMRYLWLLAVPFFCLALLAASNAPGFIWAEEGFGYDVLEYHLQVPKEYFLAGRIEYLPHNVYANFPSAVEMVYLQAMILLDDYLDVGVVANMIHLALAALTVFAAWVAGREWSRPAGVVAGVGVATAGWLAYLCGLAYVENGLLFFGMTATALLPRAACVRPPDSAPAWRWIVLAGICAGFACACKYTAAPFLVVPLCVCLLLLPKGSFSDSVLRAAAQSLRDSSPSNGPRKGSDPERENEDYSRRGARSVINVVVFCTAALVAFSPWLIKNQIMTGNPVFPLVNGLFDAAPPGWGPEQTRTWDSGHLLSPRQSQPMERLSALWTRIPGDRYQRFGPLLLLLPFVGLLWRSRGRADAMLLVLLFLQVAAWLLATHLYARFAVVMLIPLALLCGRALAGRPGFRRTWIVAAALVIGASWNFAVASRLHHDESPAGAPASLIYNGNLRGYEYFRVVNNELPEDARILLIGDAKAFYFRRRVDYCVVFNRNPFVEAVRAARTDAEIIAWLQDRAYTHVLVNWSEVNRLRRTYGFADEITPGWFDGLGPLGLEVMAEFLHPASSKRYVTLYRVP